MWTSDDGQLDLVPFRDGVAVLREGSVVVGHVATVVDSFRGLLLIKQARVWFLVTWLDGTRERIEEDYPPWTAVLELMNGHLSVSRAGREEDFGVEWLSGPDRDHAWKVVGINKPIGAYM